MKNLFRISVMLMVCIPLMYGKIVSTGGSGKWSAAATWEGGILPIASDTVFISSGHIVTLDTNSTVAMLTVKGNAVVQFDGLIGDNRRVTSNGNIVVEALGKILPSEPFSTGNAYARIDVYGSLIVDGTIEYSVKGSISGTRYMEYIMMLDGGTIKNTFVQGTGTIGVSYFQINKKFATDTVTISPGVTLVANLVYIGKGTLNNTANNVATYNSTRFDNASVFLARPAYRGKSISVAYLGNSDITAGVEVPDTVQSFTTQYPTKVVTLTKKVVVMGSLNLSDGRVNTGKYTLKVNGTVSNTGFAGKGFVIGLLEKPVMTNSDTVKTFEVGTERGYAEVKVKFFKLTPKGSLTVSSYEQFHEKTEDTTLALKRFWSFIVKDSVTFGACDVTVRYVAKDFGQTVNEEKEETLLQVVQYNPKVGWMFHKIGMTDTSGAGGTIQTVGLENLTELIIIKKKKSLSVASPSMIPGEMELHQNYPNPFNPSTTINFQLSVAGHVSLTVYDAIGREVALLVNETKDAGRYVATFDASHLSSGPYFYRLRSGNTIEIKKMLLLQ